MAVPINSKTCRNCNITKDVKEFNRETDCKDGHARWCRTCHKRRVHERARVKKSTPVVDDLPGEIWRAIPGYEGFYEASSEGRIKGFLNRRDRNYPHIHKQYIHPTGYLYTALTRMTRHRCHRVHGLIMLAHRGSRPTGFHINHINADKTDNRLENLEYCTAKENNDHSLRLGLRKNFTVLPEQRARGVRNKSSKLLEDQVRVIKMRIAGGEHPRHIAYDYGVSEAAIYDIRAGRSWWYVTAA